MRDTSVPSPLINEWQRFKHTKHIWDSKSHIVFLLPISLHPKMTAGLCLKTGFVARVLTF